MTRAEKNRIIGEIVARYENRIGAIVVSDDGALVRLLGTLRFDESDGDVGEYLSSYLVACRRRARAAATALPATSSFSIARHLM